MVPCVVECYAFVGTGCANASCIDAAAAASEALGVMGWAAVMGLRWQKRATVKTAWRSDGLAGPVAAPVPSQPSL